MFYKQTHHITVHASLGNKMLESFHKPLNFKNKRINMQVYQKEIIKGGHFKAMQFFKLIFNRLFF